MLWQDYVVTIGAVILTLALIPSLLDKNEKPAFLTSVITGTILFIFSIVYQTLSLTFSAFVIGVQSIVWFILAVQKYHEQKPLRHKRRAWR